MLGLCHSLNVAAACVFCARTNLSVVARPSFNNDLVWHFLKSLLKKYRTNLISIALCQSPWLFWMIFTLKHGLILVNMSNVGLACCFCTSANEQVFFILFQCVIGRCPPHLDCVCAILPVQFGLCLNKTPSKPKPNFSIAIWGLN